MIEELRLQFELPENRAGTDLLTLTVVGLVLAAGVIAVKTGYSLFSGLGVFLLAAIVAETPQRPTVERAMQGMRDVVYRRLVNPALMLM